MYRADCWTADDRYDLLLFLSFIYYTSIVTMRVAVHFDRLLCIIVRLDSIAASACRKTASNDGRLGSLLGGDIRAA